MEGRTGGYCAKCLKLTKDCTCLHDFFEKQKLKDFPPPAPRDIIKERWQSGRKMPLWLEGHDKNSRPITKNNQVEKTEGGLRITFEFEAWVTPEERESIIRFMQGF